MAQCLQRLFFDGSNLPGLVIKNHIQLNRAERIASMLKTSLKFVLGLAVLANLSAQRRPGPWMSCRNPISCWSASIKYNDPQIKPRKFAEADAKALYDLFIDKNHLGVNPKHIKLLLGKADAKRPSEPATRENILKAVTWLEKIGRQGRPGHLRLHRRRGPARRAVLLLRRRFHLQEPGQGRRRRRRHRTAPRQPEEPAFPGPHRLQLHGLRCRQGSRPIRT